MFAKLINLTTKDPPRGLGESAASTAGTPRYPTATTIAIPDAFPEMIASVLQRRLVIAHHIGGVPENTLIVLDESGLTAINELAKGNIGFALFILHQAIPSAREFASSPIPFHITDGIIGRSNPTLEQFEDWHAFGRGVAVVDMEELKAESKLPSAIRAILPHAHRVVDGFRKIIKLGSHSI